MKILVTTVLTAALISLDLAHGTRELPAAPDERDEVARRIRERLSELDGVRQDRLDAAQRHRSELERLTERSTQLESEKRRLGALRDSALDEVESLRELMPAPAAAIEEIRAFLRHFAGGARPLVAAMRARVEGGIDFQRTLRQERLRSVEEALAQPEKLSARALGELWAWATEELRLARGVEYFNEPVELEEGKRLEQAYHLRIGLLQEFAISESGDWTGYHAAGRWQEIRGDEERSALLSALRVLQRQDPPAILTLPIEGR